MTRYLKASYRKGSLLLSATVIIRLIILGLPAWCFSQHDWNQIDPASSPSARFGQSLVTLPDGRVMVFGGEDAAGDLHNDMYVFELNGWSPVVPDNAPPAARREHAAWMRGNDMIVSAGFTSTAGFTDDHQVFRLNGWANMRAMGQLPQPRGAHNVWEHDGKLFLAGGKNILANYATLWWFGLADLPPSQGTVKPADIDIEWHQGADAPEGFSHAAVGVHGNTAYILGIWDDGKALAYDMAADAWSEVTTTGDVPPRRLNAAFAQNTNQLLFCGGDVFQGQLNILQDAYLLDIETLTWSQIADLPFPLTQTDAVWTGSEYLIFGGRKGDGSVSDETITYTPESTGIEYSPKPEIFTLYPAYPNPFNPATKIQYTLAQDARVDLSVIDLTGRTVQTIISGRHQLAGSYSTHWNGTDDRGDLAPSGVYVLMFQAEDIVKTQKVMLVR